MHKCCLYCRGDVPYLEGVTISLDLQLMELRKLAHELGFEIAEEMLKLFLLKND